MFKGSIRKCKNFGNVKDNVIIDYCKGYNCSYAVLQRVQCKEYNLQFMLLCNSCIYFAHAIKIVWYIVIFSSHNTLVFRRFAISDYMVTKAAYDEIRTESNHGETLQDFSPTSRFITCLFGCTTTQQGTLFFPDERGTQSGIDVAHGGQGILTWHRLYLLVNVVLRQKPSKNNPWQKLYCALLEMDWK